MLIFEVIKNSKDNYAFIKLCLEKGLLNNSRTIYIFNNFLI